MKDLAELYEELGELIEQSMDITGEYANDPYDAIMSLEEEGSEEALDLMERIKYIEEEIDQIEAEMYFDEEEGNMEESYKPSKKIVRLTEADLTRIVKKVLKEDLEFDVDNPRGFGSTYDEVGDYRADVYGDGRMFDKYDWIDPEYNEEDWEDWYEVGGDPEADDYDEYLDSPVGKDPKSAWSSNIPGRHPNITRGDDGPRKWWEGEKRSRLNRTGSSALRVKRPKRRD